jgi:hypothetical protein
MTWFEALLVLVLAGLFGLVVHQTVAMLRETFGDVNDA